MIEVSGGYFPKIGGKKEITLNFNHAFDNSCYYFRLIKERSAPLLIYGFGNPDFNYGETFTRDSNNDNGKFDFIDDDYLGNAYFETDINLIKGTVPGN